VLRAELNAANDLLKSLSGGLVLFIFIHAFVKLFYLAVITPIGVLFMLNLVAHRSEKSLFDRHLEADLFEEFLLCFVFVEVSVEDYEGRVDVVKCLRLYE
jgi:hypothetical protein